MVAAEELKKFLIISDSSSLENAFLKQFYLYNII